MKMTNLIAMQIAASTLACLSLLSTGAIAQEEPADNATKNGGWSTISYNAVPIEITIQANEESILRFPWRVHMGSSSEMLSMVRNVPIGDAVYLTPLMEFDNERFIAEDPASGAVMLIDITASKDAPPRMLRFVDNRSNMAAALSPASGNDAEPKKDSSSDRGLIGEYSYSILSRFAFQSVYSPERVITPLDGLSAQTINNPRSINDLIVGENVIATPIAEWRSGSGLYITAVLLRNMGQHPINMDPRNLRHTTTWRSISFWSTILAGDGEFGDETAMVVVSTTSWNKSIQQEGDLLTKNMSTGR